MQFVYSIVNNSETLPIKGKISKWRHLQTIITQLLVVGLLFFIIFQNGTLRKSMNEKLSHQLLEDLIEDKVALIQKRIDKAKVEMWETNQKNQLRTEEIKVLIRILAKQIGLPLPDNLEQKKEQYRDETKQIDKKSNESEQSGQEADSEQEQTQDIGFISSEEQIDNSDDDEASEEENEDAEQTDSDEQAQFEETDFKQKKKCSSIEYFQQTSEDVQEEIVQNNETNNISEINQTSKKKYKFGDYVNDFMEYLVYFGHLILIILVFTCIFIVISLAKNPEYHTKSGQSLGDILKMGSKDSKDSMKMSTKELLKLK